MNKVYPYKKIIAEELYENAIKYFLDHDCNQSSKLESQIIKKINKININSKIITFQHAELISKWIDRLEITDMVKNLYEFKLLYRHTRDSLDSNFKRFHEICDNQSHTVTIVKVKDSNEILGGYNPIGWKSDYSYGITKDSFVFSFNSNDNILSRVINEKNAIHNHSYDGPSFGFNDLHLLYYYYTFDGIKLGICCKKTCYEKMIGEYDGYSDVENFEVFQIV